MNLKTIARIVLFLAIMVALSAVASAVVGDPGRPRCMIEIIKPGGGTWCVPWDY